VVRLAGLEIRALREDNTKLEGREEAGEAGLGRRVRKIGREGLITS
jgi:hypothetical protein